MQFHNRTKELEILRKPEEKAKTHAQMTIIVGRRRIGKTTLLM
jgi:AAA+ ATPase superfamily predicted ATPase